MIPDGNYCRCTSNHILLPLLVACLAASHNLQAADHGRAQGTKPATLNVGKILEEFSFRQNGQERTVAGRVVLEAADGGILVQSEDGVFWTIEQPALLSRRLLDRPFAPLTHEQLGHRVIAELPAGFRVYTTTHYVVCYNTSRAYARWTGSLLERLHKAFIGHWINRGMELHEPEFPLPVIVFADRQAYEQASRDDLPGGTGNIVGYYSMRSNRVNMFDLSGTEAMMKNNQPATVGLSGRRGSLREISQMLSQPAALPLVATIVHEATHQIAFNCGMQARYADIPLWLCEGMAIYFETPDLSSSRGWSGIGGVNYARLEVFRENLSSWDNGSLRQILLNDQAFRNSQTALEAYANAWALNYYLIQYEPKAYTAYLKTLAGKRPLVDDDPQTRLNEFQQHFGDLLQLEQRFLKQMARVK